MSTQTANTTEHRPEWIRKASEAIAGMYHRDLAAAEQENAKIRTGVEHAETAMHAKADSAKATTRADAKKTGAALAQGAANAKQDLHETQQKIAEIIHRHFQQHK